MGESYRGLTIRLGADTSDLKTALAGVNRALGTTQSELRKIQRGLKLDGSDLRLAGLQVEQLGERSDDLQSKLRALAAAESQLRARGLESMSRAARNASMGAERMREAFNEANARLERLNRSFRETAAQAGLDAAAGDARELVEQLRAAGLVTEEQAASWRRLAAAHERYQSALEGAKELQRFRDLRVEMAAVEAEARDVARRMSDIETASGFGSALSRRLKDVSDGLREADRSAESLSDELRRLDRALEMDPSSVEAASLRARNLEEQARAAESRAEALRVAIASIEAAGVDDASAGMAELAEDARRAEDAYVGLRAEVSRAAAAVDEMEAAARRLRLDGDASGYEAAAADVRRAREELARLEAQAREAREAFDTSRARVQLRELRTELAAAEAAAAGFGRQLSGGGGSANSWAVRSLAVSLSSTLTPAVMGAGYAMVDAAETFDAAYRDMRKTVSGTEEQFEELRQAALDYASEHVTSADTILEIEAMGGQLGIAVDRLEEFAVVASNLDIATDLEADEIAQTLGQLANVLGWAEGDMARFGDALVRLGNNMPAMESDIVDITKRIGAAGAMYGMTTPEILSWATAIAATGQNSEAAGTAISNSLSDIENAVASGGAKLDAFAQAAGMSSGDFARLWETDASSAFRAFIDGLAAIEAAGGSADVTLTGLGITGVRQKQALKGLSQTTDVLADSLQMSANAWAGVEDQWGRAGDAATEAQAKSEGFSGAMGVLRNNLAETGVIMGEAVLPAIELVSGALAALNDVLQDADPDLLRSLAAAGLVGAAAGPVLNVAESFKNYTAQLDAAGAHARALTSRQKALNAALGAAKGLGGFVGALALGAVAGKVADAVSDFRRLEEATEGLAEAAGQSFDRAAADVEASGFFFNLVGGYDSAGAAVERLAQKQADLASQMEAGNSGLFANNALLTAYASQVYSLAGQSGLTSEQVAQLEAAVKGLNDMCGASFEVVQDQAGAFQVMADGANASADAIARLVEQQSIQSALSLAQSQYEDVYRQHQENLLGLAQAQKAYEDALGNYEANSPIKNEDWKALYTGSALVDLREMQAVAEASGEALSLLYDKTVAYQQALSGDDPLMAWVASQPAIQAALTANGQSVTAFRDALEEAGLSAESFGSATEEGLLAVGLAFDGTSQSVLDGLAALESGATSAGSGAAEGFASGVSSGAAGASQAAAALADSAESGLAAADTFSTGADAAGGFASGLRSGLSWVWDQAASLAIAARDSIANALGIASPSRVLRRDGRWSAEGFALGVRDMTPEVEAAMAAMASSARTAAMARASGASGHAASAAAYASGAHSSARAAAQRYAGPTKADIYDAVSAAIGSAAPAQQQAAAVYVDGRALAHSIVRHVNTELGVLARESER